VQCATHQSSQPTSYSLLPFLFLSDADRWGPAVRVTPYLQPRVSHALDGRRPLPAGLPRFPAFKCPHQAAVKPTFTLPPSIDSFPLLIPPPLDCNQGRRSLMAMAAGVPLSLPSRAYISTVRAPAALPLPTTELPRPSPLHVHCHRLKLQPPRHFRRPSLR
jgi:hypothetical protein